MKGRESVPIAGVSRILVRGVNWVGDTVLTYPTVQQLKTFFPESHLAILVPHTLVDLWKTFPFVDEIIPFRRAGGMRSLWEDLNLGQSLREKGFDLALILPRSFRSSFQIYLSRIPTRIGYRSEGRSFFLTHGVPRAKEVLRIHRIDYYGRLLQTVGKVEAFPSPRIYLREEDRKWAEQTIRNLGIREGKPIIGMNPGATYGLAKCWHPDRFGDLGKRLIEKRNATLFLFGKEGEESIAREISGHIESGAVDFTGKTTLLQLAALLEQCQLLVTNDTGTMHVAAAVGTPVVALFGSTDPITTGPWGEGNVILSKNVDCSPCLKRVCPTDHRCMDLITVEEVEEAVNSKLRQIGK